MHTVKTNTIEEQPLLPGFEPVEGVDIPALVVTPSPIAGAAEVYEKPNATERYFDELGGGQGSGTTTQEPPRTQASVSAKQRRPIGHVRDVEPRDSDLDPEWSTPREPLSPEQAALNSKWSGQLLTRRPRP